jgi:hypothetical protein
MRTVTIVLLAASAVRRRACWAHHALRLSLTQ